MSPSISEPAIFSARIIASAYSAWISKPRASLQRHGEPWTEERVVSVQTATLPVNDKILLCQHYEEIFENLQQRNYRVIAKVYLRLVEPFKQIRFRYSGKKTVAGKTQQSSPEETNHRLEWVTGSPTAFARPNHCEEIEGCGAVYSAVSISPKERLQLLDELYRVKEIEERFLDADPDMISLNVPMDSYAS
ncbi:uncharacterized protein N7498_008957 [Penicillium cinerascens]|uniref:Subtelomeric hrmA-associated cluster protein AFUB-079030/YDR124W-like helical bundle domain-containing protein n=1 Tax=Penicillium cinerascens TaxID=70096 RepID=A0A9W9MBA4_9EURO|nr:uncharacterized protein N7498_008957 [Penicillium cinerascens]KAJ5195519.1 hypothetical protein N7498_008957 [Penicillium cinerascens]